ncbi:hypothetical protein CAPTEDRAFT_204520 [Capitella teleta]|uniref:Uncharacterized protein n=1 Tax=Capitella teleta TaxID=283909 RepID=R7U6Q8_CAPTE|nr:hypothetical protein CAPTEDRAFT_204520 [Capitella teleta]|eukprot:ELT99336.1 hypothetical protein CAPTEDRAFT_204520 [Capitella teleta]
MANLIKLNLQQIWMLGSLCVLLTAWVTGVAAFSVDNWIDVFCEDEAHGKVDVGIFEFCYVYNGTHDCHYIIHKLGLIPYPGRDENRLLVPMHRHQFFKSGLRYTITKTVNSTPDNILRISSTHSLKALSERVKTHYINNYSTDCILSNCYVCSNQ